MATKRPKGSQIKPSYKSKITKRFYGMQVLDASKDKFAWVSKQNKNGWSLGLALDGRDVWLRNLRFKTQKDVETAIKKSLTFVFLKKNEG